MSKEYRRKRVYVYFLMLLVNYGVFSFIHYAFWGYISFAEGEVMYHRVFNLFPVVIYPILTLILTTGCFDQTISMYMRFFYPRVWQEHNTAEKEA